MADKEQPQQPLDAADQSVRMGTAAKPIIANESVLAQMEKLYRDKLARSSGFLQDLADASAWWSGGVEGPTRGLALRAQTRAAQEKELEELARNIATTKVGMAQLQEAGGALQPTGTSAPVMGGAPTTTGGGATMPAGWGTYRGVPVPPEVFQSINAYIRLGDITKANAVFAEYAKTRGQFLNQPGTFKQEDYWDPNLGRTIPKSAYDVQQETLFGRPSAPTPTAPAPVTAPKAPVSTAPTPAVTPTPTATTAARDVYRFENMPPELKQAIRDTEQRMGLRGAVLDRPDAPEIFNNLPLERRKEIFESRNVTPVNVPTQAPAPAPTEAGAPTAPRRFATRTEEQAFKKGQEEYVTGQASKAGQKVGENRGVFETAASEAKQNLQTANVMLNIIDKHPDAIGLGYKNRALGATIEGVKLITGKDIEPFARRVALSPEAIEAGTKFDSLAEQNNLRFRQEVYKGTGQVSDFETKLSERAAGLSLNNSVEANRFFAIVAAENYRTMDKLGQEWAKYKADKGALADFAEFKQSDAWRSAQNEREQRLKKLFPEIDSTEVGFGEKTKGGIPQQRVDQLRDRYGIKRATP